MTPDYQHVTNDEQPIINEVKAAYRVAPFGDRDVAADNGDEFDGLAIGTAVAFERGSEGAKTFGTVEPSDEDVAHICAALDHDEMPMRRVKQKFIGVPFASYETAQTYEDRVDGVAVCLVNEDGYNKSERTMVVVETRPWRESYDDKATKVLTDREAAEAAWGADLLDLIQTDEHGWTTVPSAVSDLL